MPTTPTPSEFIVYTDGASRKDRRGGWGFAVFYDGVWWEECGGAFDTTNNRMELMGAIAALQLLDSMAAERERLNIQLWADSKYVLDGITEYMDGWKFRGWRTGAGEPLKNRDLWEVLDALDRKHDIDWQWVRGHTGVEGNERADRLATKGVPPAPAQTPVRAAGVLLRRRAYGWASKQRAS